MRIISRKRLKDFYENSSFSDSKSSIEAWYKEAKKANWENVHDIKSKYPHASFVGKNRVVFNIKGNKYRLIVRIDFYRKVVYIRFVGTHKEYDKIDAKEI